MPNILVAYFPRKIKLSGFSAYPDGSPTQLIRKSVDILYYIQGVSRGIVNILGDGSTDWTTTEECGIF